MHQTHRQPLWAKTVTLAFWAALFTVGVLSLLPVDSLPPPLINWWDKAQHALGFMVLALLGFLAYTNKTSVVAMLLAVYGVLIELAQSLTGWRYGDALDWLADVAGILAALALFLVFRQYRTGRQNR